MIWEYSTYYNVSERISGLLHKISNEIIKRCKAKININDMLNDDVERCMQDLKDSIECGGQWRAIYQKTEKLIEKNKKKTDRKWNVSNNSIFAQIDAFVQRCTERQRFQLA
ncbi:hypothetical protein PPERSA_11614 [Pseudocohnilembus persalinus]|uniref:Dynein heavy chain tail domain-containing protein n=1 Tax=Pseudocohnilembus persalinus TaxID=266149 RepID=A0A0V0Q9Z5_PSEPJ|nr:hypothetical protein PPERSA_11614 [Pseudocohnilembus persalinus]|eukprot:KRW99013.1 hypothetical protein PPERSA_11614 [Pseudocohnilembus persalinus]